MSISQDQASHVFRSGNPPQTRPQVIHFRGFLQDPTPVQQFRIHSNDGPVDPRLDIARLRQLMWKLSCLMQESSRPENPAVPAGYTYLTQFVAHDLVDSSARFWEGGDANTLVINNRNKRLQLEVLYGAGPSGDPLLYVADPVVPNVATQLRLGPSGNSAAGACPFRDLARPGAAGWNTTGLSAEALQESSSYANWRVPVAADARSDYHVLISQLTVVFHLLHNAIVARLANAAGTSVRLANTRFEAARQATTLIYRHAVRRDLLPRLLHPAVHARYDPEPGVFAAPAPQFMDQGLAAQADDPLPLEFAYGAFRFGHSMIRGVYKLNDVQEVSDPIQLMLQTSKGLSSQPGPMPLARSWLVNWDKFFGGTAQNSHAIGPHYGPVLQNSAAFPADGPLVPAEQGPHFGMAYSDLMNASLAGLWSVPQLLDQIAASVNAIAPASFLCNGDWHGALQRWLTERGQLQGMPISQQDIASIVNDPPLPFFVLFEAEADPAGTQGRTLGILGSILVAEVCYAALLQHRLPYENGSSLQAALRAVAAQATDGASTVLDDFAANADTMASLIGYLGAYGYPDALQPALF